MARASGSQKGPTRRQGGRTRASQPQLQNLNPNILIKKRESDQEEIQMYNYDDANESLPFEEEDDVMDYYKYE